MIFYFTGTGNSLSVANYLQQPNETLVDVGAACKSGLFSYSFEDGERIGLVFPTYCYTLGDLIVDFLERVELPTANYIFAVITCGGGIGAAGSYVKSLLHKKGIELNYLSELIMPDNTVFYWDIESEEKVTATLEKAKCRLAVIKEEIASEKKKKIGCSLLNPLYRGMYHRINKTKAFWVNDKCVGCGKCVRECPSEVIRMEEGKPIWTAKRCMKCSACINRCPMHAIQYGKGTETRKRYVHPDCRL